jgi:adenylate cyclase
MADREVKRRLAAIVAADVAGYTRLMEQDEDGTVAAWHGARDDVIDPAISNHEGRIVKHTGDGFLAEFPTVQNAVRCTVAMQKGLLPMPLEFRMGVNIGDIIDDGEDIHGDGVNLAARLEAMAEPGGICVSGDVYSQVRRRLDLIFEDIGEHELSISRPRFMSTRLS